MKTGKKVLGAVLAAAMALSSITPVFAADKVKITFCLLYTSDAADEEDSVDLCGCRRIIKKKKDKI